ncbi:MnhB domain-containing protein [Sorangium sp. So ce1078]|uniref:MnhB domain-containing protein n=1 Tax=Sorangium sp. So ce1078 TaxID=3133329 RepID=UPI003F627FD7
MAPSSDRIARFFTGPPWPEAGSASPLLRGHDNPGGGFIAGLVTSVAIVIEAMARSSRQITLTSLSPSRRCCSRRSRSVAARFSSSLNEFFHPRLLRLDVRDLVQRAARRGPAGRATALPLSAVGGGAQPRWRPAASGGRAAARARQRGRCRKRHGEDITIEVFLPRRCSRPVVFTIALGG